MIKRFFIISLPLVNYEARFFSTLVAPSLIC